MLPTTSTVWKCSTCGTTSTSPPPFTGFTCRCGASVVCCQACAIKRQCVSCTEYICGAHTFYKCGTCGKGVCEWDVRQFPFKPALYCIGCQDKKLSTSPDQSMVVTACPPIEDSPPDTALLKSIGIDLMTYDEGKKRQKKKDPSLKGMQLEHILPNSSLVSSTGRKAPPVNGAEGYSEGKALIFPIGDDQSQGTEHKFITNYERSIDRILMEKAQFATVEDKVRMMMPGWERMIMKYRSKHLKGKDKRLEARRAARELGKAYLHHGVNKLKVKNTTRLRNGLFGKKARAPSKKLKAKEEFSGLD
jgi:hypothetical protein